MDILILFLLLLLLPPGLYCANDCNISACEYNGVPIRFPFRLSPQQPQSCGYTGFDVGCNSQNTTVLNLPYSGNFLVRSINYSTQVIKLYDKYNCLPIKLLKLNLSGSPYKPTYYQNYTLLSCPPDFKPSSFTTITCLSNSTSTIMATSSMGFANMLDMCKIIRTSRIPVPRPPQNGDDFVSDLSDDLELTWSIPDCEKKGGLCTMKKPKTGRVHVFKSIAVCITTPVVVISFMIAFYICFKKVPEVPHEDDALAIQSVNDTQGLDENTIQSYTKVIIGESRRIPAGPNDITCPICLSDYHAKETLKCIPECQHCFHSECIDEWLRRNGTCPVCRNSPSPAYNYS